MKLEQGKKYICIKQPSTNFTVGNEYLAITTYQLLDNHACPVDVRGWYITNFFELKDEGIKYNIKEPKFNVGDIARLKYRKDGSVYEITEPLKIMFVSLRNGRTWCYAVEGIESGMCYQYISEDLLEQNPGIKRKLSASKEQIEYLNKRYAISGSDFMDASEEGISVDYYITYDEMAEIVDYLREENNK